MSFDVANYFNNLIANPDISFSNIPRAQTQYLTHGYHRYPAKFIPTLASYLIKRNTQKGELVCDPFGGCGTTLVEAKIHGRDSIGIDINPIAGLITKAKITPINIGKLESNTALFFENLNKKKVRQIEIPQERLAYWFTENNYSKLYAIYDQILEIEDPQIRQFYSCAFSHILKNCSKWLMKSIKPTIDKDKVAPDPLNIFQKHLKFMINKNREFVDNLKQTNNEKTRAKFYLRDARKTKLNFSSVDYILTSPPYVTSYEYADLHQLSLLWFESVSNWMEFKKSFVGTSHRLERNKEIGSEIGKKIIESISIKDAPLARHIRAYFEDMEDFISESKRILKKGKKMSLVLGNTKIQGVDILNAEVAFEQMSHKGFRRIKVEKRQTSSQSITPYRDTITGRFTSLSNPSKRRAYQYEFVITGTK